MRPHPCWFLALAFPGLLGCAAPEPAEVVWIDVFASDYTLDLEPRFDRDVTEYTALADGPGIAVRAQVVVRGDADGVLVNGAPGEPMGYRTWVSTEEVVSPGTIEVQVDAPEAATYHFDVVPR